MRPRTQALIAATLVCTIQPGERTAHAQEAPRTPGSIHAVGQHEIKLPPQKLRLSLTVRAEGADAKSAIEAFMKHKERVKKELLEMKAEEASIEMLAPQLSTGIPGMPTEWTSYPARPFALQQPPSQPGTAGIPKVYTAISRAAADWPLPATDADALAMLPETLKEQIEARDLTGNKNKAKLDKVQQEKLEELQAASQESVSYRIGEQSQPLTILFVAKVGDESRKQAIKSAYDRAVAQAETLATVTGHKLGNLVSLRCVDIPSTGTDEATSAYAAMMAATYPALTTNAPTANEALSSSPSGLKYAVKVDVEFAIAK